MAKRCPNGTRKNKEGVCVKHLVKTTTREANATNQTKRCKNGTRKNPKTGNCEEKLKAKENIQFDNNNTLMEPIVSKPVIKETKVKRLNPRDVEYYDNDLFFYELRSIRHNKGRLIYDSLTEAADRLGISPSQALLHYQKQNSRDVIQSREGMYLVIYKKTDVDINHEIETIKANTLHLLKSFKKMEMIKMKRAKNLDPTIFFVAVEKVELNEFEERVSDSNIAIKTFLDKDIVEKIFNIAHAVYTDSFEQLTKPNQYVDFKDYNSLFRRTKIGDKATTDAYLFYSPDVYEKIMGYEIGVFPNKNKNLFEDDYSKENIEIITIDSLIDRFIPGIPEFK
jgi:hypothetical protein